MASCQGPGAADATFCDALILAKISGGEILGGHVVDYPEGIIYQHPCNITSSSPGYLQEIERCTPPMTKYTTVCQAYSVTI